MEKGIVIITGSSGFIGSRLIESLHEQYHIIGLDRSPISQHSVNIEHINMDITSEKEVADAFKAIKAKHGSNISSVIHLAAYYDFSGKPSPLYDEITVKGTERIVGQLQDFEVEQLIFTSSMLVYKPTVPGKKIKEHWPLQPKWDYPLSKVKTEQLLMKKRGHIPVAILRVAGVYTNNGGSIPITNQIQRIYEKQITAYLFPGDTSHGNAFIHIEDLVLAIKKTIAKRNNLPTMLTMNISEEKTLSYKRLQDIISKSLYGKTLPLITIPKFLAKIGAFFQNLFGTSFIKPWMVDIADDHYEMNCELAKDAIGWQPTHSLESDMPIIISELKNDPDNWYAVNKLK